MVTPVGDALDDDVGAPGALAGRRDPERQLLAGQAGAERGEHRGLLVVGHCLVGGARHR